MANKILCVVACLLVLPGALSLWTPCATEAKWCSFSGTVTVRYGSGDRWCAKSFTGGVLCTGASLGCGDPVNGVWKTCEIDPNPSTPFVLCANEAGVCNPGYKGEVRYGANNQYVFKTLPSTGYGCSGAAFGQDPAPGILKSCYYRADPAVWAVQITGFQMSNIVPAASGTVVAGSAELVNCGIKDLVYENNMQYEETETHSWSITNSYTGTVSFTVSLETKIPMVGKLGVSATTEFSYSRSESKDTSISTTTSRSNTITATIPSNTKTSIVMQGSIYTASIPWTGVMYQVDSSGNTVDGTTKEASGFLQSARTATYTVILKESAATGLCS